MISWCALALFLVCQIMPAGTDEVTFERATKHVVMQRRADGGWQMVEEGEELGVYYVDGNSIRCVPPPKAQAKGATEFTVDIGEVLDLGPDIDWATVEHIAVLDEACGTPISITHNNGKTTIKQRKGPLEDGVVITWPSAED